LGDAEVKLRVSVTTSAMITSPIDDRIMIPDQPKIMVSDQYFF